MRRFELVEGTSAKFWEVWVAAAEVHTRYGRLGAAGKTTVKTLESEEAAQALAASLVREKVGKGYVERTDAVPAASSARPPEPASTDPAPKPEPAYAAEPTPKPEPAPAPKPAKTAKSAKAAAAPKPPKAPARGSADYQAGCDAWATVLGWLHFNRIEELSAEAYAAALDAALSDPRAAGVAAPEAILDQVASLSLPDSQVCDEALVVKLFGSDPTELAEQRARQLALRARLAEWMEAKHSTLVRLLEAGYPATKRAKGSYSLPLENFVRSLPCSTQEKLPYAWDGPDGATSAAAVLRSFVAHGSGVTDDAIAEAAFLRFPALRVLVEAGGTGNGYLLGWWRATERSAGSERDTRADARRYLELLAPALRAAGADGLSFQGPSGVVAGALTVALTRGASDAVAALVSAGTPLDQALAVEITDDVHVGSNLLPGGQNQKLRFAAGFTSRDVAEATLDAHDGWEAALGDQDGPHVTDARRRARDRVRSLAATLAARGVPVSGLRVPLAPVETIPTPPTFKPAVDAALLACLERLGGDSGEAARRLAALDPGGFGPFVYFKSAAGAVGPLIPRERLSDTGAAWLCAYLGYDNGATFENLSGYSSDARGVIRKGTMLGVRGSDVVAVLTKEGRVVCASVRGGVEPLAPDLETFVGEDLGRIGGA